MKPLTQSKTIWVNVLSILVLILVSFQQSPIFSEYGELITGALAVINIILRVISKEEITWSFSPTKS